MDSSLVQKIKINRKMISGQPISETSRKIINPNPIHFKRVDLFTVRLICVINLFVPDHARTIYLNSNNQLKKKNNLTHLKQILHI